MKKAAFFIVFLFLVNSVFSQIYMGKQATVHFLSKAEIEDIEAKNTLAKIALNPANGKVQVKVQIKAFKFESSFMESHFNENYMESDKYPFSSFDGKINETVDYTKDGETKVTCTGKLEMHGVTKEITIPGTLKVNGKELTLKADFKVKLVDYKIKVPSLYAKKIAEEIAVDFNAVLEPFKKP